MYQINYKTANIHIETFEYYVVTIANNNVCYNSLKLSSRNKCFEN